MSGIFVSPRPPGSERGLGQTSRSSRSSWGHKPGKCGKRLEFLDFHSGLKKNRVFFNPSKKIDFAGVLNLLSPFHFANCADNLESLNLLDFCSANFCGKFCLWNTACCSHKSCFTGSSKGCCTRSYLVGGATEGTRAELRLKFLTHCIKFCKLLLKRSN